MINGEYLRQDDENLARFINLVTFYCSSRFFEHKSCNEVHCPLAKEGCTSCHPDSIMEWLKKTVSKITDEIKVREMPVSEREDKNCETEPSCFNCRWCNTYTKWCCFSNESIDGRTNACAMWECDPYEKED